MQVHTYRIKEAYTAAINTSFEEIKTYLFPGGNLVKKSKIGCNIIKNCLTQARSKTLLFYRK